MPAIDKIIEILGIKNIPEDKENSTLNYEIIRKGLPIDAFKQVASYYNISESRMASLVGVSERTISRLQKEHKRLNATGSDRLYRLARIAAHALEVFEDRNTVGNWLSRPNRALGGVAPVEVLDTDAGTEQVSELLNRIEYGVYI
jgi:putative toxin-antitoxin system antitoxin component (TIGR02293 family)